jgi:amino acid adenylation domain-containing protein
MRPGVAPAERVAIHARFEAQAKRSPSRLALVDGERTLSYGQVNRRANSLAHRLRSTGVRAERTVALLLDRSTELVIAMLGVLKAGGACVCVDPSDPRERIDFVLDDAEAMMILTRRALLPMLSERAGTVILCLDDEELQGSATGAPREAIEPDQLAFVFYTTGSTGRPKGVMQTHGGRTDRLTWEIGEYAIRPTDRVLLKTPVSFARLVKETFWPLSCGGAAVLAAPGGHRDSAYLLDLVSRQRVTVAIFIPSQLALLVDEPALPACDALRLVLSEGEPLTVDLDRRFRARMPSVELGNAYGLTEASTVAVWRGGPASTRKTVPSGRAAGLPVYILSADGKTAVPAGEPGEIFVGGTGIARGYLNRPAETAERFVTDPFAAAHGARMYRTGDLGRFLSDGTLEHLGRSDDQVKLHGFRVEIGEIEHVLREHPHVSEAAVCARDDEPGVTRLVAYVVAGKRKPMFHELRHFLKRRLPEYMLPARYVELESLPRTANGKVDRRALPPPAPDRPQLEGDFVAPRNPLEEKLAEIWERLLGVHPVGATDDFFELGGYSLLAALLFSEIERQFGRRLALSELLAAPTIARQAELLRDETARTWSPLVTIQTGAPGRPPFFCVHGLFGNVLCFTELARCIGEDQAFFALQSQALDETQPPLDRVEALAEHYLAEVRNVQTRGPYFLGGYSFGGMVAFEMARRLVAAGELVALLALIDASSPDAHRAVVPFYYTMYARSGRRVFALDRLVSDGRLERNPNPWKLRELSDDALLRYRRVEQATTAATRAYRPAPYDGRVDLIRATAQGSRLAYEPHVGWGRCTGGGLRIHDVPGDHVTLLSQPWVMSLGERLRACLDEARAQSSAP